MENNYEDNDTRSEHEQESYEILLDVLSRNFRRLVSNRRFWNEEVNLFNDAITII